jgi:hypothetical protein
MSRTVSAAGRDQRLSPSFIFCGVSTFGGLLFSFCNVLLFESSDAHNIDEVNRSTGKYTIRDIYFYIVPVSGKSSNEGKFPS